MNPDTQTLYTFTAIVFAACMALETVIPQRSSGGPIGWRWVNNFSLGAIAWYITGIAGTWLMIWLASNHDLRQLALLPPHMARQPVLGFLLLVAVSEFFGYWAHRLFHNVSWLWPIHAVHHADTEFDVSTSYRNHPLEPLLMLPLGATAVVLLGSTPLAATAYRLFTIAIAVFSHANIRLPQPLERVLRLVILTPGYHLVHHSTERRYTNSNYGTLLPWFDYLFGTYQYRSPRDLAEMEVGLEYWRSPRDTRLDKQLLLPLRRIPEATGEATPKSTGDV